MTHCVVAGGQELPRFPWVLVCVWVCLCACAHLCTKSQAVVCVAVHLKVVQQPLSQDKRREIIFLFTDIFFYSFLSSCRFDNDDSCQSVNYGAVLLVLQCVIHYYYWCIYFFCLKISDLISHRFWDFDIYIVATYCLQWYMISWKSLNWWTYPKELVLALVSG